MFNIFSIIWSIKYENIKNTDYNVLERLSPPFFVLSKTQEASLCYCTTPRKAANSHVWEPETRWKDSLLMWRTDTKFSHTFSLFYTVRLGHRKQLCGQTQQTFYWPSTLWNFSRVDIFFQSHVNNNHMQYFFHFLCSVHAENCWSVNLFLFLCLFEVLAGSIEWLVKPQQTVKTL